MNRCPEVIEHGFSMQCWLWEGHDGEHLAAQDFVSWTIRDPEPEDVEPKYGGGTVLG